MRIQEVEQLFKIQSEKELSGLFKEADKMRKDIVGDEVTYVLNLNVNFTNICSHHCGFCAYGTSISEEGAYFIDRNEIIEKINKAGNIVEICVQGGIHPELNFNDYINILKLIRTNFPGLHIHAFSPEEVNYMAEKASKPVSEVLRILKENGLDSMPGTAAEILDDEIRNKICPNKINTKKWIEIIKTAHKQGIPTSSTILIGHIEEAYHKAKHLEILKNIQEETGSITEFIPLPFIGKNTELGRKNNKTYFNNIEAYKMYAISRLYFLGLIEHIQVSWPKLGVESAKQGLLCGADDFGGTLGEENITKAAGGEHGEKLSENEIIRAIESVGRRPVRRNTVYQKLERESVVSRQ